MRLGQFAAVLDGDRGCEVRAAKGTIPPKFILQATIDGIDRFITPAPADNVLVTSLETRMRAIAGLRRTIGRRRWLPRNGSERVDSAGIRSGARAPLSGLRVASDEAGLWSLPKEPKLTPSRCR